MKIVNEYTLTIALFCVLLGLRMALSDEILHRPASNGDVLVLGILILLTTPVDKKENK